MLTYSPHHLCSSRSLGSRSQSLLNRMREEQEEYLQFAREKNASELSRYNYIHHDLDHYIQHCMQVRSTTSTTTSTTTSSTVCRWGQLYPPRPRPLHPALYAGEVNYIHHDLDHYIQHCMQVRSTTSTTTSTTTSSNVCRWGQLHPPRPRPLHPALYAGEANYIQHDLDHYIQHCMQVRPRERRLR